MAMVTQIDQLTGATPTATAQTSFKYNRDDTNAGTTAPIPAPVATGTNFSWVKSLQMEIVTVNSLNMTNILVGKVANETTTGTKIWAVTSHSSYTQATATPTATGDNNVTAPTLNGASATALALISAPPSTYAAGGFNTTGRKGNIVELVVGVDATCVTAGTAVATPTIRFSWTEG